MSKAVGQPDVEHSLEQAVGVEALSVGPPTPHQPISESLTLVMTGRPEPPLEVVEVDVGTQTAPVMERTATSQSIKQVEFDPGLMVEGKRVLSADGLQLPSAAKQRNESATLGRERWRTETTLQAQGPSVQLHE